MKYLKSDQDWLYNSRLLKGDNKWLAYGEGYREAIELLEKHILEVDRTSQDFLIFPYCYLIRHYIEIRLKETIDEGNKAIRNYVAPSKGGHDLSILWKKSQEVLKSIYRDQYEEAPKEVSTLIKELHSIDVKSDNFRYPIDKNGHTTLDKVNEINFKELAEAFQVVKYYLDGITDVLAVAKENSDL